jgi:uncharacterized protein YjiS (DUF1127 family)
MTIPTLRRPIGAAEAGFDGVDGSIADPLTRCRRALARWIARSRQRRALREIADSNDFHLLKDIGVSQEEAFREADKPFWRR